MLFALNSCTKESRELTYANQQTRIENFVKQFLGKNEGSIAIYQDGIVRIVVTPGEGDEARTADVVRFHYAGYDFSGGSVSKEVLFATNYREYAESVGWNLTGTSITSGKLSDSEPMFGVYSAALSGSELLEGLRIGLQGVKSGEECYILFNGKYGFGKAKVGTIPANAPLAFRIWVDSIEKK